MTVTNMAAKPGIRAQDANEGESVGHFCHSTIGRAGKSLYIHTEAHGIRLLVT